MQRRIASVISVTFRRSRISLTHQVGHCSIYMCLTGAQIEATDTTCQEAEQVAKDSARENMMVAERKANTVQNALEEAKTVSLKF